MLILFQFAICLTFLYKILKEIILGFLSMVFLNSSEHEFRTNKLSETFRTTGKTTYGKCGREFLKKNFRIFSMAFVKNAEIWPRINFGRFSGIFEFFREFRTVQFIGPKINFRTESKNLNSMQG